MFVNEAMHEGKRLSSHLVICLECNQQFKFLLVIVRDKSFELVRATLESIEIKNTEVLTEINVTISITLNDESIP